MIKTGKKLYTKADRKDINEGQELANATMETVSKLESFEAKKPSNKQIAIAITCFNNFKKKISNNRLPRAILNVGTGKGKSRIARLIGAMWVLYIKRHPEFQKKTLCIRILFSTMRLKERDMPDLALFVQSQHPI